MKVFLFLFYLFSCLFSICKDMGEKSMNFLRVRRLTVHLVPGWGRLSGLDWGGGKFSRIFPTLFAGLSSCLSIFKNFLLCRSLLSTTRSNVVFATTDGGVEGNGLQTAQARGFLSKTEHLRPKRQIKAWLDSGANETMFKEPSSIAKMVFRVNTKIDTAGLGDSIGSTETGEVELKSKFGFLLPGFLKVIFTPKLTDNLASVGRIAEGGLTIVFNSEGSKIYENKGLKIVGKEVHSEGRDKATGLYPITLSHTDKDANTNISALSVRQNFSTWVPSAGAVVSKVRDTNPPAFRPKVSFPEEATDDVIAGLVRLYVAADLNELQRWHDKCGHMGVKQLKRLGIKDLQGKGLPDKLRCESCIKGKIHRLPHKEMHLCEKPIYKPGECIVTDLMGPYSRSYHNAKYAQAFRDLGSGYRWLHGLTNKTKSEEALVSTLIDAKARSGRDLSYLKSDGDGIFRSKFLEEAREKFRFIHLRSAPYDHDSNAEAERDVRTLFEGTATSLAQSGAPSTFWEEALKHFVFTRNNLPTVEVVGTDGKKTFLSPRKILEPGSRVFNLNWLVPFGTLATCYIPKERRVGGKTPAQKRSFKGAVVGYEDNMDAYRVYDFEAKKIRAISFSFAIVQEGFFPFRSRKDWEKDWEGEPVTFYPTRESVLDEKEWGGFDFDSEEEAEVLSGNTFLFTLSGAKTSEYPSQGKKEILQEKILPGKVLPGNTSSLSPLPRQGGGGDSLEPATLQKILVVPEAKAELRRSSRETRPPEILSYDHHYKPISKLSVSEKPADIPPPKTLGEAKKSAWWKGYEEAIFDEIDNLEKLGCWNWVDRKSIPFGTNILRSKLVFDDKRGPNGEFLKFKARMVAMGFTQIEGVDYNDTFASVVITKTFRTFLVILNLDPTYTMEHWDIKQAFVNAPLDETIYVYPVKGFEKKGFEKCILKLNKALYGTKQAAYAWQKFLRKILIAAGGIQHPKDECVFIFREPDGGWLYICTHVDDIFPLFNILGRVIRDKIFAALSKEVTVENRGLISWALSTKIERDPEAGILKISQEEDINYLLRKYDMENCKGEETPMSEKGDMAVMTEKDTDLTEQQKDELKIYPYRNLIGKLWWITLISRPDIIYAVHRCACYQNKPSKKLWLWLLRILRYLKHTKGLGLVFERKNFDPKQILVGCCDASFLSEERSLSRYGVLFFVAGALVHWASTKTSRIVSSSTEAEINGLVHLGKENIWEREFHQILGYFSQDGPTRTTQSEKKRYLTTEEKKVILGGPTIGFQDNTAAISLSKGGPRHKRSKHFGLEFDLFREYVLKGELEIKYKPTEDLVADLLTKPLSPGKFCKFRDEMMGGREVQEHFK